MRKMKVNKKIKEDLKPELFEAFDSEKHYRELIMLFTSWRNETTDLIKQYSSYEQHYLQVKNIIDDKLNFMLFVVKT